MDPTGVANKAAENLLSQGTLGTFAVVLLLFLLAAGWTIRRLYADNQQLHGLMFERLSKALSTVEAATAAIVEGRGTSQALAETVEALGKAVSEISHANEVHDREVKHGLNNTAFALTGLKEKLDKVCEKLQIVRDHVVTPPTGGRRPQ